MEEVRIKKGVRPHGGRRVQVVDRTQYPNGRRVVVVLPPTGQRSRHHGLALGTRTLEYEVDEVEPIRHQAGQGGTHQGEKS